MSIVHWSIAPTPLPRSLACFSQPAVESAVTRLLVSTGALFEALTQWSELNMTEGDVSDVYVCLCNDLNAAVAAFTTFDIDTKYVPHSGFAMSSS